MTGPLPRSGQHGAADLDWRAERLSEARAVIADIVHHSDSLIRIACRTLIQHGQTEDERKEARLLLVIVEARHPIRRSSHGGSRHEP